LVRHLGSGTQYEFPLQWETNGSAESAWQIPQEAKLGQYDIMFVRPAVQTEELVGPLPHGAESRIVESLAERTWLAGAFRVEELRVRLMKGIIQGPATPLIAASEFPVDLSVRYLAGGGAGKLPVTLRAQVRTKTVATPEGFGEFTFANGNVKEGIARRGDYED